MDGHVLNLDIAHLHVKKDNIGRVENIDVEDEKEKNYLQVNDRKSFTKEVGFELDPGIYGERSGRVN